MSKPRQPRKKKRRVGRFYELVNAWWLWTAEWFNSPTSDKPAENYIRTTRKQDRSKLV